MIASLLQSTEEQALQARSTRPRLFQLDALRGLAAVVVMFSHFLLAFPRSYNRWNLQLLSAGRCAVVLFFVLSGYVLSMPYWSGRSLPYGRYLIRRVCRIYLPFAAAAALAIAGAILFRGSTLSLTPWFNATWHIPITAKTVAMQFLMFPLIGFNTAFWSLTFEMVMSILMPLLCRLLAKTHPAALTAVLALALCIRPLGRGAQIPVLFCAGAVLARYQLQISTAYAKKAAWRWPLFILGLVFLLDIPFLLCTAYPRASDAIAVRDFLLIGFGASLMLISSLHVAPLARALQHSLAEYLGRISYSAYLIHATVLFALMKLLYGHMPTQALLLLVVVTTFAVAHLFCVAIEEPSMRLGKRLTGAPLRARS